MANTKVRLKIRIKFESGPRAGKWAYYPIARAKNKSIKVHWAMVDGVEELHKEGVYTLLFRQNGKQCKETVEPVQDILAGAVKEKEGELQAIAKGHKILDAKLEAKPVERPLVAAVTKYFDKTKTLKAEKTHGTYSTAVREFTMSRLNIDLKHAKKGVKGEEEFKSILADCNLTLDDIKGEDAVLAFIRALQDKGNGDRTRANKVKNVRTFFLQNSIPWPLSGNDMPTYTEKLVKTYSKEQMVELMAKSTREEYERHQFFLGCGGRDEEVQFAFYTDVNFNSGEFNVSAKPGFKIKGRQERSIPIPESLVKLLWERRKRSPNSRYIFPAPRGGRNVHFLRLLKNQVYKNGFNCGACTSKSGKSCADHPVCEHWILHRFRKTFATMHYRSGKVTMKTLQRWLGHENLETTEVYLADEINDDPVIRAVVNSTFAFANEAAPPPLYL